MNRTGKVLDPAGRPLLDGLSHGVLGSASGGDAFTAAQVPPRGVHTLLHCRAGWLAGWMYEWMNGWIPDMIGCFSSVVTPT